MQKRVPGFTIVELLIVIVVIGILATITIVAYNGIRSRAVESGMQSDLETSAKLLQNDATINNGQYPATTSAANNGKGLPASNGNTYSYSVNNGASPPTFSLTISNPSSSNTYRSTSTSLAPQLVIESQPIITYPATDISYNSDTCGSDYFNFGLNSTGTGSPTPTIQWQKMTPKNTTSGSWSNISGGTTAYYTFATTGLIEGDYQTFRVIYTSGSLSTTSPTIKMYLTNGC